MERKKREDGRKGKEKKVSRRTFLKKSVTAVGAAAAGFLFPYVNTRGASNAPIRIGGLFNMTGFQANIGFGEDRSAAAAVQRINQMGGILGRPAEYILEDAATNPQTAIRKIRKLIMENNCDFVIGPCHSGIDISCLPVAKSLNTFYFPVGTSLAITAEKGNRYGFRGIGNVRHLVMALAKTAIEKVGKRYYCFAPDYEWGHSFMDEAKLMFNKRRGILVGEGYSPMPTEDFIPYLNKMDPKQFDVLILGHYANDIAKFSKQAQERGNIKGVEIFAGVIPIGMGPKDFGPMGEQMWFICYGPHRMVHVPENLKAFNRAYRDAIKLDDEGRWKDLNEWGVPAYNWAQWEHCFWIKKGIEKSGWESKKDNLKFIEALEGMSVTGGYDFITGPKTMRAKDHQAFTDLWVVKIKEGNYDLKSIVKADDLYYEPTVDFTKEEVG